MVIADVGFRKMRESPYLIRSVAVISEGRVLDHSLRLTITSRTADVGGVPAPHLPQHEEPAGRAGDQSTVLFGITADSLWDNCRLLLTTDCVF